MTFTQLEYVVAVDNHRHFASAAEKCFVTQPTLSMQLQKLEEELGIKLFDRSKQPVMPTDAGIEVIEQAKKILAQRHLLQEMVQSKKGQMAGDLRVAIIPTLAPYLLPLFVQKFTLAFPNIHLIISEMTTDTIVAKLKQNHLDVGILVTPLNDASILEQVLFYEELMAYVSKENKAFSKTYMLPKDIDPAKLWLLEEGHCLRSQIINLCELKKAVTGNPLFNYEAGSIETLRRMVDMGDGITIIPELAKLGMSNKQLNSIRYFKQPSPMREVSIATHRHHVKKRFIEALIKSINQNLPEKIKNNKGKRVVEI